MIARFSAPASTLEQSQAQLHLLVEQVREYAIFLLDMSGHVHTWNTGAERIKGYEAAEIVGQHFSVFYTPEDIARGKPAVQLAMERIRAAAYQVIADRSEIHCEYRVVWPDGSVRWVSSLGRCFFDEAGRTERLIGVVLDITSRKRAEDERAELLEREKVARATNDFLAVLSHELRTPLHSIVGWTQMLKSGRLDETRIQKALATIDRNVMTQTRRIEDLLDVSRIIAGKLRLELRPLDLTSAVELAVESAPTSSRRSSTASVRRRARGTDRTEGSASGSRSCSTSSRSTAGRWAPRARARVAEPRSR